jgi:hypothetical protein
VNTALGKHRCSVDDNIKIKHQETECDGVQYVELGMYTAQLWEILEPNIISSGKFLDGQTISI